MGAEAGRFSCRDFARLRLAARASRLLFVSQPAGRDALADDEDLGALAVEGQAVGQPAVGVAGSNQKESRGTKLEATRVAKPKSGP